MRSVPLLIQRSIITEIYHGRLQRAIPMAQRPTVLCAGRFMLISICYNVTFSDLRLFAFLAAIYNHNI